MSGPRLMQRQELVTARAVMLPPGGTDCDELVYVVTDTVGVPDLPTPDEHAPLGPVALVALTDDGRWVWARAFRLPYEVEQRRREEERVRAEEKREAAVEQAIVGLYQQVADESWPGTLRRVRLPTLRAMVRAAGLHGSRRFALEYEIKRWAEARVDAAQGSEVR